MEEDFLKWLSVNARMNDGIKGKDRIKAYQAEKGFVADPDQLRLLQDVLLMWYDITPYGKPMTLSQLFKPGKDYYIQGFPTRKNISPELRALLKSAGWIYNISPETTYFEIIDNKLFAKYQRILGSRFLCIIEE